MNEPNNYRYWMTKPIEALMMPIEASRVIFKLVKGLEKKEIKRQILKLVEKKEKVSPLEIAELLRIPPEFVIEVARELIEKGVIREVE